MNTLKKEKKHTKIWYVNSQWVQCGPSLHLCRIDNETVGHAGGLADVYCHVPMPDRPAISSWLKLLTCASQTDKNVNMLMKCVFPIYGVVVTTWLQRTRTY